MSGEKGVERKCRSCSKWSFFPTGDPAKACQFCGVEYGKVELGLDVFVDKPKRSSYPGGRRTVPALNIDAPKPGEFGGGRR